jgi:beta-glucuronidase
VTDRRSPLVTWLPCRRQTSLDGDWPAIIDVYDVGVGGSPFSDNPKWGFPADRGMSSPGRRAEYDFDRADTLAVPGDWNTQR